MSNTNYPEVTKASGERAPFDPSKLKASLQRAGADSDQIGEIRDRIEDELYEGISTHEIYSKAFKLLKKLSRPKAARYKLKKAILELGPTGYPFERLVGALLERQGYKVQVGVIVQGYCVSHEVDVVADREDRRFMIECKYHNRQNHHCDVKVPLYIHSRFNDVSRQWDQQPEHDGKFHQGWIVTNTRFTTDAIDYANCAGLKLIGWDHPDGESLRSMIDRAGLHPITSLSTLSKKDKQSLLKHNLVLCKDLIENKDELEKLTIKRDRIPKILEEARGLVEEEW